MSEVKLYLGDCLEILPTLAAGSVDAVVTDPPYGTQDLGGGYGRRQIWGKDGRFGRMIENDVDLSAITKAFPEIERLIFTGWAAVFFAPRKTPEFITCTSSNRWFGSLVWDKGSPGLGYHIRYSHEDIAIFKFGEPDRPPDAILSIIHAPRNGEKHPHEKPISLMKRLINWVSNPGDTILDPFMGSGTTGVACVQTGRNFIGIEIDPTYYAIAEKRIKEAQLQIRMEI